MAARSEPALLTVAGIQSLIDLLRADGWTVAGPTVRDGAITHAEIASVADLPVGTGDEQSRAGTACGPATTTPSSGTPCPPPPGSVCSSLSTS